MTRSKYGKTLTLNVKNKLRKVKSSKKTLTI